MFQLKNSIDLTKFEDLLHLELKVLSSGRVCLLLYVKALITKIRLKNPALWLSSTLLSWGRSCLPGKDFQEKSNYYHQNTKWSHCNILRLSSMYICVGYHRGESTPAPYIHFLPLQIKFIGILAKSLNCNCPPYFYDLPSQWITWYAQ